MDKQTNNQISKLLSRVLRHRPDSVGLQLDSAGWVSVEALLDSIKRHDKSKSVTRDQLQHVVETNDKQRFEFNASGTQIRARQGHSIAIELGYQPATPPETLLHGTPNSVVPLIRESGLKKMQRHHVHLHIDETIATAVGARRGKPVLLVIQSGAMHRSGHIFYATENKVWLTDHVPPKFINFPEANE